MSAIKSIRDDLNYGLAAFGIQIPEQVSLDEWAGKLAEKPAQNTATLLSAATVLFYLAERGHNPKVRDIYDAAVYCTTNISVGYCDIFAHTPAGKMIGSALMTIGPAMAAKTLDGTKQAQEQQADATQEQILETLQQILSRLTPPAPAADDAPDRNANGHG
jgi:hypothetical protein